MNDFAGGLAIDSFLAVNKAKVVDCADAQTWKNIKETNVNTTTLGAKTKRKGFMI
ncbi:hypothetical protein CTE07_32230 [Chitinophaga terrae (ex Kim and Jung 2007)]|nr:hypothetical protein CTE07_32230 [Chitinophaga terrae (ex Kim and Jung 2007)]